MLTRCRSWCVHSFQARCLCYHTCTPRNLFSPHPLPGLPAEGTTQSNSTDLCSLTTVPSRLSEQHRSCTAQAPAYGSLSFGLGSIFRGSLSSKNAKTIPKPNKLARSLALSRANPHRCRWGSCGRTSGRGFCGCGSIGDVNINTLQPSLRAAGSRELHGMLSALSCLRWHPGKDAGTEERQGWVVLKRFMHPV